MAELTFKSAGVSTREIDLSQPSKSGPVGVPAGIIGTANEGPAFVPLTFANYSDFASTFGRTDGEKFGPLAVHQWLSNAQAVTYMRVLGAGSGKKRSNSGDVENAGFTVGDQIVQENGNISHNSYATVGDITGRTYFLGALLSESNGSTIFSSAGIQVSGENKSAPILRGVLLAPSGVILHLSGTSNVNGNVPVKGDPAEQAGTLSGRHGGVTGSINLSSQEFVMLMNGFNNSDTSKKTYITASLDMTSPNYFANVFNTNPLKIEEEGHLLYASYDVYPDLAVLTGSGVITAGAYSDGAKTQEDIVFLLTSSIAKGDDAAAVNVPEYETFNDRFREAYTP